MLSISNAGLDTGDRIIAAAASCVVDFGVDRVTLAEIARRAGVSRPTVYRRWPDTRSIVAALLTQRITGVMRDAPLLGDDRESLVRQIVTVADLLRRDDLVMSVMHSELAPIYITERLGASQQMLIDALAGRLRVAQRHGSVRAGDPLQMATMVLLITQSTIQSERIVRPILDADALAAELTHSLNGYLSVLTAALNAARRTADLNALAEGEPLDLVVIGGGITGAGIALDAASRGLRVALVEKHDLAFGTSRWSSKLVHGGLRYLASGNVGIARRSAIERGILMTRNAPHLVHAMPQLVPLLPSMGHGQRALVRAGFLAGDALRMLAGTPASTLPHSRRVSARRVVEMAPTVRRDGLDGGLLAYDGQLIDDARLVTAVARTAAQHGARILTYVAASEATGTSVRLTDRRTGQSFDVSAGAVINAAGVWAGEIDDSLRLRPSRGTHLVFDAGALGNPTAALTIPIPGELNRFVFAMPEQLGRVYLGLTDEAAPGPIPDVPEPSDEEVAFLLDTVNTALGTELATGDVIGAYAGLRPLIDTGEGRTADVSREHAVVESPAGVISIIGGKLTEYRYMAEDVLDRAISLRHLRAADCRTRNLPLIGAPGNPGPAAGSGAGLPPSLVARYGAEASDVVASAGCDRPAEQVAEGIDVTRAEFEYAVTHECALDVDDILDRRTRIGLVRRDRERVVSVAAEFLAGVEK